MRISFIVLIKLSYSQSFVWIGILTGLFATLADELRAAPPNVLLIVSEDNGPELGCYGDPYAKTPHLDRLAAEGVRFDCAFVPQAGCSQSRASLLTGLYPHQHGQIGLATWGFRLYRADTPNLPRSLKAVGYRTGIIGKLHINPETTFPFDCHEIPQSNFQRRHLRDYARHAATFIDQGKEPFFLSVNFPDAHDPWLRQVDGLPRVPQTGADVKAMPYMGMDPPALREMVADYYNSISRLDTLVGDLLAVLERSGKARQTIVIYLGDHGADMLRGKRTCYEGGLRIPLILRWPERIQPQVCRELVSTIDLMPTLLTATGAADLDNLPGSSWLPLLSDRSVPWRKYLFSEYHTHAAATNYHPQRAVRNDRYKLIENLLPNAPNPDYAATFRKLEADAAQRNSTDVTGFLTTTLANAAPDVAQAYTVLRQPPRYELYDLQNDPYEFRNLAASADHAPILAELSRILTAWRRKTNDPLLDAGNLERLTAEVTAVTKKKEGKSMIWGYPEYFFRPAAVGTNSVIKSAQ